MMRIVKTLATSLSAVFLLVAAPTVITSAEQPSPQMDNNGTVQQLVAPAAALTDCARRSAANGAGQSIFLSTASPKTYPNAGGAWQDVDCTSTSFRLNNGVRALVVADFNAEADCNGTTPTNGQWCQTRALLNGLEGAPVAAEPSSFAFDSVAGGANNWQAHTMSRAWEIRCGNANGCSYKFTVQTRMHDASVTGMWIDEVATHLDITYGAPAPL